MGVLRCDRRGCENVMCDRLSYKFGYICDDCFQELKESDCETMKDVNEFMDTPKSDSMKKVDIEKEFSVRE